jgi:hypothetical protein
MKKYFHENNEALLEIPDFLLARNRPPAKKVRCSQAIKYTSIKPPQCPKGYKLITLHFGDEVKSIPSGVRTVFYKQGRKWVYVKETKPNARAKKIPLAVFNKILGEEDGKPESTNSNSTGIEI